MWINILIVLGGVLAAFGVVGLIFLFFQPIAEAILVVFKHDTGSLAYYTDKGRELKEEKTRVLKRSFAFFLVMGAAFLSTGLWFKYAPRGNDSLWSENVEGVSTGNDNMEYQDENGATGKYTDADGKGYLRCVRVKGKTIYFNDEEIGGTDKFEEYIKPLDREPVVLLKDDYAASATYHKVVELLDYFDIKYKRGSDE